MASIEANMNNDPPPASILPSGSKLLTSIPDCLMVPELVTGGLVWILVAAIKVLDSDSQGWVMFVSVTCFALTLTLLLCYGSGCPRNSTAWCLLDVFYHSVSSIFYFSAAVLQANSTIRQLNKLGEEYRIDIAASVFSFLTTALYVTHAAFTFKRWKTV